MKVKQNESLLNNDWRIPAIDCGTGERTLIRVKEPVEVIAGFFGEEFNILISYHDTVYSCISADFDTVEE